MIISLFLNGSNNKIIDIRSRHQSCSMKKVVLRNFTKFTGKHLCQSLFFKLQASYKDTSRTSRTPQEQEHLFYRTALDDCF